MPRLARRESAAGLRLTTYGSCPPVEGDRTAGTHNRQERKPGSPQAWPDKSPPVHYRLRKNPHDHPDVVGHDAGQHHSQESRRPPALRPTLAHVPPAEIATADIAQCAVPPGVPVQARGCGDPR
ncbi:hypothetical protein TNCT6_31090 [Streptomyces sp. 6-11-2]|nr:hypothetical protein TNCT6_31090 [Streptomyces sp. 6-11-2]